MELAVFKHFTQAALLLPQEQRSELANRLLESISHEQDVELSAEWSAEIDRRLADIDAGRAELIGSEEVWKEVNQRFPKH